MASHRSAWHGFLPGGLSPSAFSLEELRAAKNAHQFLTETVPGPDGIAYYVRAFRYLLFFGCACIIENTYPPLTRCWKHLERVFRDDPAFDDDVFIPSWILMDFPFGPAGETALDYFEDFVTETAIGPQMMPFIDEARRSRMGLYQDVMRTKNAAKFRELFTGHVIAAFPSVEDYGRGEILLTRTMTCGDQVFLWGNPKGFPKEAKTKIEHMVRDKLFYFDDEPTVEAQYERFMKLAGPYWMSSVTKNDAVPIFDPDHYLAYLAEQR